MNQEKIWAYFQNEGIASFEAALPRYTYLQRKVQRLVDEPGHILNIGVGSGKLEGLLVDSGYAVAALDPDSSAIDKLVTMGINARVGVAQNLPFQDESFDAVVASEVLEHLDVEDSARRSLKFEGCSRAAGILLALFLIRSLLPITSPFARIAASVSIAGGTGSLSTRPNLPHCISMVLRQCN